MTVFEEMYKRTAHNYTLENFKADEFGVMSKWYDNYLSADKGEDVIPKIIHQVWVGGKPIPELYKSYMCGWVLFHPLWEYRLWTDDNVSDIPSINPAIYNKMTNVGAKSDYIRYAVLHDFGGLYADTDFECLKSHDDLLWLSFFSSVADNKTPCVYAGHMGCHPRHKTMQSCLSGIHNFNDSSSANILNTTSVYFLTRNIFSSCTEDDTATVMFPPEYFYPFPGNMRKQQNENIRKSFCTENTYAIHHWGTSWIN
jgi:mannosyltransferase OCH1-like enzyme